MGDELTVKRVSAELVLTMLRQSGYIVTAAALRQWVRRGHIQRHPDGYDLYEIWSYLDTRDVDQQHAA